MSSLIDPLFHMQPPTTVIGSKMTVLPVVDSTQTVARDAAQRGARGVGGGCGPTNRRQGRLGRDWWSPAEGGLYVSLLLRPRIARSA
ncbi:MAG: hypothetical protein R2844_00565 [Caldilineales bacterium]